MVQRSNISDILNKNFFLRIFFEGGCDADEPGILATFHEFNHLGVNS